MQIAHLLNIILFPLIFKRYYGVLVIQTDISLCNIDGRKVFRGELSATCGEWL
jgi:hypothetical protein